MEKDAPKVVKIHDVNIDKDYMAWLNEIKARYNSARAKAAVKVNSEQLLFNWQLGRDLVIRKAEERWGAGVVEQLSLDLKAAFPGSKGFSARNLWYMKNWYSFYASQPEKLQQLAALFQATANQANKKLQQLAAEIHEPIADRDGVTSFPEVFSYIPGGTTSRLFQNASQWRKRPSI